MGGGGGRWVIDKSLLCLAKIRGISSDMSC